jgi:hypothetical protein
MARNRKAWFAICPRVVVVAAAAAAVAVVM